MSTHNIPFSIQKRKHPKLPQICSYRLFFQGTQERVRNSHELSVFEPLKFYFTFLTIFTGGGGGNNFYESLVSKMNCFLNRKSLLLEEQTVCFKG